MSEKPRPLSGLRVLDFTRVYSGPLATLLLSDLGADVVKVEHTDYGDDSRSFGPLVAGTSGYFETLNRGKRAIAVNYKIPAGQLLLRRLIETVDVLVENFRPGQMSKYGLDYSTLKTNCPGLIYVSISGFGQNGPEADRGCYDIIAQAEGGLMGLTGLPDLPCKTGPSIADAISGLTAAVGLLAALWGRERNGHGACIDISMVDALFACLENALASYTVSEQVSLRQGNSDNVLAPFDCYRVQDSWIVIGIGNDWLWRKFALLLDDDLAHDARFHTNAARLDNYVLLQRMIEEWCSRQTVETALGCLHQAGIPAGAVRTMDELSRDPRLEARGMLARLSLSDGSSLLVPGTPIRIAETKVPYKRGPRLGEHTHQVLSKIASDSELNRYAEAGIIGLAGLNSG